MKKKVQSVLKIGVAILLISWLVQKLDWQLVAEELQNIEWSYIVLFVFLQLLALGFSAKKWQTISQFQNISFTLKEAFSVYLTGTFVNNFLPSTIGGDIYRSLWLVKRGAGKAAAFSTVIFDRYVGLLMTLALALLGGFFVAESIEVPAFLWLSYLVTSGILLVFGLWILFEKNTLVQALIARIPWSKLRNLFKESLRYNRNRELWKTTTVWTALFMFVGLGASNYILFLALGYTLPIMPFLGLVFMMALYVSLPLSINNLGVKEWAYGVLFVLLGVSFEVAVTVALLSRLFQTIISLLAVPFYFAEKKRGEAN